MAEINPTNELITKMRDEWHAIIALMIHKLKVPEVVITLEDVADFRDNNPNKAVLCYERKDGIHLMLITEAQARELAEQELSMSIHRTNGRNNHEH